MSDELMTFGLTGLTLYAVVYDASGQPWNTSSSAFEAFDEDNWGDYAISLTGAGRVYTGDFAGTIGTYAVYQQLFASPDIDDTLYAVPSGSGGGAATIDQQDVADALLLAPSGTAAAGSAMKYLVGASTFNPASDGVILAATQSNYAPAKAGDIPTSTINAIKAKTDGLPASPAATGDAMTLTSAYDAAKGEAGANATATGFATPSDLTTLQTHGDSTWATATGFATPSDLTTLQTHGDSNWATADVSALATSAGLSSLQTHGDSNWATADVSGLATGASITSLQSHGDSSWATATGFATPSDLTTLQTHGDSEWATADVSGLATGASITSLQSHGDSSWATATGFSTFDPANDTVAHVTLVDTTTTNTDMRGTNNAYTGTPPSTTDMTGAMTTAGFSRFNAATDAVKVGTLPSPAPAGYGGSGSGGSGDGRYAIDHDGGTGDGGALVTVDGVDSTDNIMQFVDNGVGVGGLTVNAYLKSNYDANNRTIIAQVRTLADGTWSGPMMLDSGTYYIVADGAGDGYQAKQLTVVVP